MKRFLISIGILFVVFIGIFYIASISIHPQEHIVWGVTFSDKASRGLGLDPQKNLLAIVKELHPKAIRLVAYWDAIEKKRGQFDFSELDGQFDVIRNTDTKIILALGMKLPRWPECHVPDWASSFSVGDRETALRAYMQAIVNRYKDNSHVALWQIENEPYFVFGDCPQRSDDFMEKEIALVKSLDSKHPMLVTDSGELSWWYRTARLGDVFGTSIYRKVYVPWISPLVGLVTYPLPPQYYRIKEGLIRTIIGAPTHTIVAELQTEPWSTQTLTEVPYDEQIKKFSPEDFKNTIEYARRAGFDEYYLWGAEWFYYMKEIHHDSRFWDFAKTVLQ